MHLTPSGSKVVAICVTCEPFALASGLNKMSLNLATPEPKPDARPDASAFGSLSGLRQGLHHVTTIVALKIHLLALFDVALIQARSASECIFRGV